ncbi:MAG: hypothetical protein QM215_06965 [Bacillota bacterium]|jgi:hypothetical protein|nr:hypothetical protein [Eubacteriales bacterium]MDI9492636.1 hypothetical protein [Bacillota bacterium]NLV70012.1 hypothetical protein [Clostridiales bacterium]MDD3537317.1 hypothetical protein [Eubacteriales bacterium]MDD4285772.1 hypothetical protein [Eubacteriales bacterium]
MKYVNGFTINATGSECFITYLQTRPQGQAKTTEEMETVVMSEQCARQLVVALAKVYQKVDSDRAAKRKVDVKEVGSDTLS